MTNENAVETIEQIPLAELVPYARNARTHSEQQVQQIAASIREFGFLNPVLIDEESTIIAGHGRVLAGHVLGLDLIPCSRLSHLSEAQKRAYVIADNQLALNASWDTEMLGVELSDLKLAEFDLDLLGFDPSMLKELTDGDDEELEDIPPQTDRADELQQEWKTEAGQLWVIKGQQEHRLLCGDATAGDDISRLLGDADDIMCVTDPPYGVEYDPAWRTEAADAGHLAYADRRVGKVTNDDRADWREAWELFPGNVIYSWHPAGAPSLVHAAALQDSGFPIRMQIIWAKSNFPIGRGDYHVRHEPCWYAVRKGKPANRTKDRTQTTLWEINLDKNVEGGHSTQKPLECMARAIRNHTQQNVYDPFLGSGTTMLAAEQLNRRCYGIEISPAYCAVILQRMTDAGCECSLAE